MKELLAGCFAYYQTHYGRGHQLPGRYWTGRQMGDLLMGSVRDLLWTISSTSQALWHQRHPPQTQKQKGLRTRAGLGHLSPLSGSLCVQREGAAALARPEKFDPSIRVTGIINKNTNGVHSKVTKWESRSGCIIRNLYELPGCWVFSTSYEAEVPKAVVGAKARQLHPTDLVMQWVRAHHNSGFPE